MELSPSNDIPDLLTADALPLARCYQVDALETAIKNNTIVFMDTGSGKTLIAIMLLRSYAHFLRKPSPFFAVFLVPQVVLVRQQAEALQMHTDLKVGMYWGEMGIDFWDGDVWQQELDKHDVLVMTPQILLNCLRHSFFKLSNIKVLVFDECHHASGKHPYACIMTEFYHHQLNSESRNLPRILGMTASLIKTKCVGSEVLFWEKIHKLESLMHSKVYTCSRNELANFIPFSTPKFKFYKHMDIPYDIYEVLAGKLNSLKSEYERSLKKLDLSKSAEESAIKKLEKIHSTLIYCLDDLGVDLALKAAEFLSSGECGSLFLEKLHMSIEKIAKRFCFDALVALTNHVKDGPEWSIGCDFEAGLDYGLLSSKIVCLIGLLLEYRHLKDIRCIVFVQRVIAAVAIEALLTELLPKHCDWQCKYIAGSNLGLQTQTRKAQNDIVEEFSRGNVNIIVATSILEEGLDVQSCNLVIRFDPSVTVSSFIQSGGRARMRNSDYVLMLKSDDFSTQSRLKNYLISGEMMRKESIRHASVPCSPLSIELSADEFYCVESTGARVTLDSSVCLIYFYCSRLPSDGYFKPVPRFVIEKETNACTLYQPKSCPLQKICVQGNIKVLKKKACLEACKQLHEIGALTDKLVPDILAEEATVQEIGKEAYDDEQPIYFPPELVIKSFQQSKINYFCYVIRLHSKFEYSIPVNDFVLVLGAKLDADILSMEFELEVDRGLLMVKLEYLGELKTLNIEMAFMCCKFQTTIFEVLLEQSMDNLEGVIKELQPGNLVDIGYFLLPSVSSSSGPVIDWDSVASVLFSYEDAWEHHVNCSMNGNARAVQTKSGLVCTCMLQNSLVHTPHNGKFYCITGIYDQLNGRSLLKLRNGGKVTYKKYYEQKYNIKLKHDEEPLLRAHHIFPLQNYFHGRIREKRKDSKRTFVELPPELCCILMSPISISTLYSFTFIPAIMHRLESLLLAVNLKKMHLNLSTQTFNIPSMKVLEAITTKKCQEEFHLESLETLGDSFLKYATCQQLFKTHQNHHEGLLSIKKDKIISNAALAKLGCDKKLPGFIRNQVFDPRTWRIPGSSSRSYSLSEQVLCSESKIYNRGTRKLKSKTVADVVEALIGAYVSTGGEVAGLLFMDWIGMKVDFMAVSYDRHVLVQTEKYVNVQRMESILKYSFKDPSLLLEALTHGSYMIPEIPRCYQRLEFLGDSVLDFLITAYLYKKYPGMSPGLLTDMRSASVNNDCYAQSALRLGLNKDILHASHDLHKHITETVEAFKKFSSDTTYGWESEISFPKVLGDVIESLAGAIFVDSGFNKEVVFESIRPLLEPLITPDTLKYHPVRELHELCQKHNFEIIKPLISRNDGTASLTVGVNAKNKTFRHTSTAHDKKTAQRIASREVVKALKEILAATNKESSETIPKESCTSPAKRSKFG